MDPQPPITPEVSVPSTIPDSSPQIPKDNHWVTIASMAVFVLLALGAVVFLYNQNQKLKVIVAGYQVQTTNTPYPTTTSPTLEPTASSSATPKATSTATSSSTLQPSTTPISN